MSRGGIRIAVVGMGFGRAFVPIYQAHPDVAMVGICDANHERLDEAARALGVTRCHADLDELLASRDYDAVHIATRVDQHAAHCVRVLASGKHCASAVPMGLSLEEIEQVREAQRHSGLTYMMMETSVYGMDYLYAKELRDRGEFGDIQFLQGYHSQDLAGYPEVWRGFPPMWYITHAVAPLLDIVGADAVSAVCLGSGVTHDADSRAFYANPVPIATAMFALRNLPIIAQVTRTLFDVAPYGGEGFNIWGSKTTLITAGEITQISLGPATPLRRVAAGRPSGIRPRPDLLPAELAAFADGGHGGSHPHLANEFITSIVKRRAPYIHANRAASWCAPGICAHISMLAGGAMVEIPRYV